MDPISQMIIMIKNAANARKELVTVSFSKLKFEIAKCLEAYGFLKQVTKKSQKGFPTLELEIFYDEEKNPKVHDLKRISKPSRRVYYGASDIKPVKQGYGIMVLSTPKGIMTGKEAKKEHVGGEALFQIW